jgi:hypothetical protein
MEQHPTRGNSTVSRHDTPTLKSNDDPVNNGPVPFTLPPFTLPPFTLPLSAMPMIAAFPLPIQERILLRHCGGFLPPLFSSNRLDKTTHQRASSAQHWNIYRGSAGLEALQLRSRLLSGGLRRADSSRNGWFQLKRQFSFDDCLNES